MFKSAKLSTKFLVPILIGVFTAMAIGAATILIIFKNQSNKQLEQAEIALKTEQSQVRQAALEALKSKADVIGKFMAKTAPDLILSFDFSSLSDYQKQAMADSEIAFAAYLKPDGSPLTEFQRPGDTSNIIEKNYSVISNGENLGSVLIGLTTAQIDKEIQQSNSRIKDSISSLVSLSDTASGEFFVVIAVAVIVIVAFIGLMVVSLFKKFVINPTLETDKLIQELSAGNGDLSIRLPVKYNDEIYGLRRSINAFIAKLHELIIEIVAEVDNLVQESDELKGHGAELSNASASQSSQSEEVATAMNQMAATVKEVFNNTKNAAAAASKANDKSHNGRKIVEQSMDLNNDLAREIASAAQVVEELAEHSQGIGAVLGVIRSIADQTNLLALNAAIEAARAGEQGRGFAVVADEVRTLASRTQQSTEEIQSMIEKLQAGAGNAVEAMSAGKKKVSDGVTKSSAAGDALIEISEVITNMNDMNTQIASASEEQSNVVQNMTRNIESINTSSRITAATAQRTADASQRLAAIAGNLQKHCNQFNI